MSETQAFSQYSRHLLNDFLVDYGYKYEAVHHRPRGETLEFCKPRHRLFASCEGGALYIDLIHELSSKRYVRISLNQALWFSGYKSLPNEKKCFGQLRVFIRDAAVCCGALLQEAGEFFDERYCFPMSDTNYQGYLIAQREK